MEQISRVTPRTRRTSQQIRKLLSEFKKGDMRIKDFSALHNISRATFHKWKSRYESKKVERAKRVGFAELKISPVSESTVPALFAELRGIKLYQPVDAAYLKKLLS